MDWLLVIALFVILANTLVFAYLVNKFLVHAGDEADRLKMLAQDLAAQAYVYLKAGSPSEGVAAEIHRSVAQREMEDREAAEKAKELLAEDEPRMAVTEDGREIDLREWDPL